MNNVFCIGKDVLSTGKLFDDSTLIAFINLHSSASAGSIIVKDGVDASGEVVFKATINANESSKFFSFNIPLKTKNGLYIELMDATASIGYFG